MSNYIYTFDEFIVEMSNYKNDFENKLQDQIDNIIENWCLCRYCTLFPDDYEHNYWHNHWTDELNGDLSPSTKNTIKKVLAIKKTIVNRIFQKITDNHVLDIITSKFKIENINLNNHYLYQISTDFINEMPNIIDIINSNDKNILRNYCDNI